MAAATHDNRLGAAPSKLDPFTLLIDEILLIDLDATRKRATPSPRIYRRLIDEHSSSEALR